VPGDRQWFHVHIALFALGCSRGLNHAIPSGIRVLSFLFRGLVLLEDDSLVAFFVAVVTMNNLTSKLRSCPTLAFFLGQTLLALLPKKEKAALTNEACLMDYEKSTTRLDSGTNFAPLLQPHQCRHSLDRVHARFPGR